MLKIYYSTPDFWEEKCKERKLFFFTDSWMNTLTECLNVNKNLYVTDHDEPVAIINIFSRYIFKAAYLNFPIGGVEHKDTKIIEFASDWVENNADISRFDLIANTLFTKEKNILPRTLIVDLRAWDYDKLPSALKRNIRKSKKSNVVIKLACENSSKDLYDIYQSVLKRHNGKARYTQKYFVNLLGVHLDTSLLNIYVAYKDHKIIGYICVAFHADSAFYMHGGMFLEYSSCRAMDYLFSHVINEAKIRGVSGFDFLASPLEQPSLVKYKEKWGGKTFVQNRVEKKSRTIKGNILGFINR